jgi:hypothetical protein
VQHELKTILRVEVVPGLVRVRARIGQRRELCVWPEVNLQRLDRQPQVKEVPVKKAMKALLTLIIVKSLSVAIKLFLALNISNNIVIIRLLLKLNSLGKDIRREVEVSKRIRTIHLLATNAARVVKEEGEPLKVGFTGVGVVVVAVKWIEAGIPDEVEGEGVLLLPTGTFHRLWPLVTLLCL